MEDEAWNDVPAFSFLNTAGEKQVCGAGEESKNSQESEYSEEAQERCAEGA